MGAFSCRLVLMKFYTCLKRNNSVVGDGYMLESIQYTKTRAGFSSWGDSMHKKINTDILFGLYTF